MTLPLPTSYAAMEALSVPEMPVGPEWQYEPKWDGFRCLVFRDGDEIALQSKSGQPLVRYFPELADALRRVRARRFVIDGEIVIPAGGTISFDDLLMRIHPAESRIRMLADATPAMLIVFDLLADERGANLARRPLAERRPRLEKFFAAYLKGPRMALSPATTDPKVARRWFDATGGALDGIIAKRRDAPYASGDRTAMVKVKRKRTADCVVGGFRYASSGKIVGSLLLGLYEDGVLHHVGFTSSLSAAERKALTPELEKLVRPPGFDGRAPGGPSRWSTKRSGEWQPLAPKLVAEVEYDHFTGGRFRHGTKFMRFRPDKAPRQCTFDQVDRRAGSLLRLLKPARGARARAAR